MKILSSNIVYIIRIGEDLGEESRYIYSKRVCVHFPEYAAKYSCWESAYHSYKNSDYYVNGEKAAILLYDRNKNELVEQKNMKAV